MLILKNFYLKYFELLIATLFLILCVYKFNYYFSGKELGGWDTTGHFQLAKVYASGFREFRSLVWDDGWFCGFPAFYFYPSFFYFVVTFLFISLPISFVTAFGTAIFFIIPLLAYSIHRFFKVYLGRQISIYYQVLLSYTTIFFYFSYAGDGLQGTSLIGMWEGTFISNLGHAFLFLSLSEIEKFRITLNVKYIIKFIVISSLLICTHFLSSFFWFLAVSIHILLFYKFWLKRIRFLGLSILAIFIISLPSWINYVLYSPYTSGVFYGYTYPPLLSILGKDVYDKALAHYGRGESFSVNYISLLIISGRIISILAIIGFLFEFRKNLNRVNGRAYALILSIFFIWLSLDNTVGYIFPGIRIHNYRAFDTFYIGFSAIMVIGIFHLTLINRKYVNARWTLIILFLFAFRNFIFFDPPSKEGLSSPYFDEVIPENTKANFVQMDEAIGLLPRGSLVFPEITRGREYFSSPHFWSNFLRKHKLRNALGLTVESSLFPTLMFNWESAGLPNTFRWGTEIDWSNLFFEGIEGDNFETQLPAFFQRSGIQYVIGHSQEFRNFIISRPKSFLILQDSAPFILAEVKKTIFFPSLPAGFVSDSWYRTREKIAPNKFLRESNTVLANLHAHNIPLRIINSENELISIDETLRQKFSLIFLYVNSSHVEESYSIARSYNSLGLPVILLRAPAPKDDPMIWDWNVSVFDRISKVILQNQKEDWKFTSISYFPALFDKKGTQLFHSDSNQIATFKSTTDHLELDLPKFNAILLTLLFIFLPISYFTLSLTRKMQ